MACGTGTPIDRRTALRAAFGAYAGSGLARAGAGGRAGDSGYDRSSSRILAPEPRFGLRGERGGDSIGLHIACAADLAASHAQGCARAAAALGERTLGL